MARHLIYSITVLAGAVISCATPSESFAQKLLAQPFQMTLLQSKTHDQTHIRLAHDFPGYVQMRLVYAYFDGDKLIHRISTALQGFHKVWSLRPLPATAENLQFLSLTIQYGEYTLQCDQEKTGCTLWKNGSALDSSYAFNPRPLASGSSTPAIVGSQAMD